MNLKRLPAVLYCAGTPIPLRLWQPAPNTTARSSAPVAYAAFVMRLPVGSICSAIRKTPGFKRFFSITVFLLGLWLGLSPVEWAILLLTITINWMAEFVNAAIEAAVNLASPGLHPMARVGKDVGAAAVLLTSVAAAIIGSLILGPPLLTRLEPVIISLLRR